MAKNTYSKMDIIELVREYGGIEYEPEQTTLEKRLQEVIEFLNEARVQHLLKQQKDKDPGGFFYNNEMNLTKAEGGIYKGYNYNLVDAIFLAILISLFDHPFFKDLKNESRINNTEYKCQHKRVQFRLYKNVQFGLLYVWPRPNI